MTISTAFALATDAQFRELSNFITPPRAGRVTALEGNGQVRVATDDPDGGDVLAWPLNGFAYAVDDVVYIAFAVNNPESALVIGSKGATPTLDAYVRRNGADVLTGDWDIGEDRRLLLEALQARAGEGLVFATDEGTTRLQLRDDGSFVRQADSQRGVVEYVVALPDVSRYATITIDITAVTTGRINALHVEITMQRTSSTGVFAYAVGDVISQHPFSGGGTNVIKASDLTSDSSGSSSFTVVGIPDGVRFTFGGGDFTNTLNTNMIYLRASGYSAPALAITVS